MDYRLAAGLVASVVVGCSDGSFESSCGPGEILVDGDCARLCNGDADCPDAHYCDDGVCAASVCGDSALTRGEECDAGGNNGDSALCTSMCRENVCGDGLKLLGTEDCDDGNMNDADACRNDCTFGSCSGGGQATAEVCDGIDNDCDGETDEAADLMGPLASLQGGVCAGARQTCVVAAWDDPDFSAISDYEAVESTCDDLDNDCDGLTDEGCPCQGTETQECGTDVGACAFGTQTCSGGQWGPCLGATTPAPTDPCGDGLDNDCDGVVDEGCACDFNDDPDGECAGSSVHAVTGMCQQPITYEDPETPASCDMLDNDCDGAVDEACPDYETFFTEAATLWVDPEAPNSVNLANDRIDWQTDRTTAGRLYYDLQNPEALNANASDAMWVVRLAFEVVTKNSPTSSGTTGFYFTLSDGTGNDQSVQDALGMRVIYSSVADFTEVISWDDGVLTSGAFTNPFVVGTYWLEVRRTSITSITVTIYSDGFQTVWEEQALAIPSTVQSLRYIKLMTISGSSSHDARVAGRIDWIQVFDGVAAVP